MLEHRDDVTVTFELVWVCTFVAWGIWTNVCDYSLYGVRQMQTVGAAELR